LTFDVAPAGPGEDPVTIDEQANPGDTQAEYAPYSGGAAVSAALEANDLVLTFDPALENARVYKLTLGPDVSAAAPQSVEIRAFFGDVNSDGVVNAVDRSVVVGAWTGPGFTPNTDVNHDGSTNALDRSFVVGAWTGSNYCP
jgi:hypothetical protein